jgi:hypothetical protein
VQPLLQWKNDYPARNAQAPYCHLWPALLYNIFPHYNINGTILGKKVTEYKIQKPRRGDTVCQSILVSTP